MSRFRPKIKRGRVSKEISSFIRELSMHKPRRKERFLRSRTLRREELSVVTNKENKNDIVLGASDISDYFISVILENRDKRKIDTHHESFGIYCTKKEWKEYVPQLSDLRIMDFGSPTYFFDDDGLNWLETKVHSTHISVDVTGDIDFVEKIVKRFKNNFDFVKNEIEWIYTSDGSSIDIPLQNERMPLKEMYPFLGEQTLENYYDDFIKSSASILLLIGPPGTGKTTFIRGLLQHTNSSATLTYDANILEKDYVFASFVEGDKNILILEDADMFLKSRKEGNTMMHKFLNVGDGLVTTRGKKMIFSTNLPSIKDIDPALVRPGRCYDILHFGELTQEQAETLAKKVGVTLNGKRDKWSVADIFYSEDAGKKFKVKESKLGFI
jgi:hypothetical protein